MDYTETRRHELRKRRVLMVDGNLTLNSQTSEAGASARVQRGGYWGFASSSDGSETSVAAVRDQAARNADAMSAFGRREDKPLPQGSYRGEHVYRGRPAIGQKEIVERLSELHAYCKRQFPDLTSTRLVLHDEHHSKWVTTSNGSEVLNSIQRALLGVTFTALDAEGKPVELNDPLSGKGSLADLDLSLDALAPRLDALYRHLQAKRHAVPARGGLHQVVLAPQLAGILAHEAMGHPCEADIVLAGAVTGDLLGQRVASELVTMVDFAHTYDGAEVMIPVYADDEGMPSRDATLIERGVLKSFMNSRETAARLGHEPSGSARAYAPSDEPLVRMRNTAILPGKDKLDDMIAGMDDGYLLLQTSNGQADTTTEFMFGIPLAYEIRGGKLGRAIRDTTVSGSAIKVLQSVDAVSDDMVWNCGGYCGKKQFMVVSMGGPALRAQAHLGGE